MFIATTKADTYRGSIPNEEGDLIDGNGPANRILAGEPFSIIEVSKRIQDPSTQTWRTVRKAVGRCTFGRDVRAGDRILDLTSQALYVVDEVNRTPRSLAGVSTVTFDLSITGNRAP